MKTAQQKIVNRTVSVRPAAAPMLAQRKAVAAVRPNTIQTSLKVSSPRDPDEQEADATSKKIMRMVLPAGSDYGASTNSGGVFRQVKNEEKEKKLQAKWQSPHIARYAASGIFADQGKEKEEKKIQRKGEGRSDAGAGISGEIQNSAGSGASLPLSVRSFMEPRFQADFSRVKIHTGDRAADLNRKVSAQAFAVGSNIYFGKDSYNPDSHDGRTLIAHELTHTIQQGGAVHRSPRVSITPAQPHIQRSASGKILDWIADKANNIPGFRMFTVILGVNPINMNTVDRSAANILRALIEFMPGGAFITQALDNHGVFNKAGAWVENKISALGMVGQVFKNALSKFIDSLGLSDLAPWNWGSVWDRAKRIFTEPIDRLISFAKGVAIDILKFVKDAILKPLAALAQGTRGYDLLKAILGEDPITGEKVPRNAENLIGGFMKFIGQEEIWENIKKGNAIARAWTWFQGALGSLMGMVRTVPGKLAATLGSLTVMDIITIAGVFGKVAGVFVNIAADFISWGLSTTWNLLEIIFDVVKPGLMGYIKKTGAALKSILKNPLPFVGNLVRAAKLGFQNFAGRFGDHLKAGLIDWLTGSLSGVYVPKALSLTELGKFAMSMLGITWAQIRGKIVKALGPNGETIMKGLETGFDIVVKLVTGGPAAAWELIKEKLTELKDQVVSGIVGFVTDTVIKKAVPKLIAMFIPGAGFISAIISIYDTIMVFVQKISKIVQVVVAFIDSIVTIAAGNITAAAKRVESILAGLLSLAISFLAGFLGLGKVTDKIMEVIEKVRASVDKALGKAVEWIVDKAKSLYGKAKSAVSNWWKVKKQIKTKGGENHNIFYSGEEKNAIPMVASKEGPLSEKLIEWAKVDRPHPLIEQTSQLVKKDPSDPNLFHNVEELLNIYEDGGPDRKTELSQKTGSLGGDTVGLEMTVDWLGPKHPTGSVPEKSAQTKLMGLLVTEPKKGVSSDSKYIRGHLLNHELGGKGNAANMFPITGYANGQHLRSTEGKIKSWLNEQDKEKPKYWVWYQVKVQAVSSKLDDASPNSPNNWVNSEFACHAILKDVKGKEKDKVPPQKITSVWTKREPVKAVSR